MAAAAAPQPSTPYASASLYVGDLLPDVTEALLYEVFGAVGPVASVRVCRDAATRRSLGYAYVNFHRVEDAERALDTMNFKDIRNRPCRIMWSHRDPSLRKSGLGNVFVKGLDASIDNKKLFDTFSTYGNILSCKVAYDVVKQCSLGYGFVHYETEQSAVDAIEKVKAIAGKEVVVCAFKPMKERGFTNVYIKNFADWTEQQVVEEFKAFGSITSQYFPKDDQGKLKGFGFVAFETADQASSAVATMHGKDVGGPLLYVARAQKKGERQRHLRARFEQFRLDRQRKFAGVNVYVKNLSDGTDDAKLTRDFAPFGTISSARVMHDETGKSKGFGFVCFTLPEEASKAIAELNGHLVDNKPLYVALAQRKDVRRSQLETMQQQRAKLGQAAIYGQGPLYYGAQRLPYAPPLGPQQRWPGQQGVRYPQQYPQQYPPQYPPQYQQQYPPLAVQQQQQQQRHFAGPSGGRPRPGPPAQVKYDNARNAQAPPQPQLASDVLTSQVLAAAPEAQRKQMIGERLFPLIRQRQPDLAGKITGMLLEMENGELLLLLEDAAALAAKIDEALDVLNQHKQA